MKMAIFSIPELEKMTPFSGKTESEFFFRYILYHYQKTTGRKDDYE
jgi:hypothetical protein